MKTTEPNLLHVEKRMLSVFRYLRCLSMAAHDAQLQHTMLKTQHQIFCFSFLFTTYLSFLGVNCVLKVDLANGMCFCRNCDGTSCSEETMSLSGFQGEKMFLW